MKGALDGVLVLDFSTLLPGPLATLLLAEAGAEVIKVERPGGGDEMRGYAPRWGADSVNFALLNRSKRSLVLDLKDPASHAVLDPLIARADVVVEQFRPGVMDRLGLGHAALAAINPRLITCSITGFGQTGPKRHRAGHDLDYLGDAGMIALSHGDAARPVVPPALIADIGGGAYPAVMNILLALRRRDATGAGCHLDIAMSENVLPFLYWAIGAGLATGQWPGNGTDLVTGGTPRYRLYPTADGRLVCAAPIEQKFWEGFLATLGLAAAEVDDAGDPAGSAERIAALIAARPASYWRDAFAAADCCCSIAATIEEAMQDPHFAARGVFARRVRGADGTVLPALPVPIAPVLRAGPDEATASMLA